jgi:hypothetical protein
MLMELPPSGSRFDQRGQSRALVTGPLKLAVALKGAEKSEVAELFDLASDPGEMHPNPPALHGAASRLEASLRGKLEGLAARGLHDGEKGVLDEATKEKLRALGYKP